jgi:hypothetical protein
VRMEGAAIIASMRTRMWVPHISQSTPVYSRGPYGVDWFPGFAGEATGELPSSY